MKKLTPEQADEIVKNVIGELGSGFNLGSLQRVKDWLEENTLKIEAPASLKGVKEICPQCHKPMSEHSKEENIYTCPS